MRELVFGATLALGLVACNGIPKPSPIVGVVVGLLPADVREAIRSKCGWLEPTDSLRDFIASYLGDAGVTVNAAAEEFCTAVQTRPNAARGRTLIVRGVPVRGRFVGR